VAIKTLPKFADNLLRNLAVKLAKTLPVFFPRWQEAGSTRSLARLPGIWLCVVYSFADKLVNPEAGKEGGNTAQ